jgi:hypothetical protein
VAAGLAATTLATPAFGDNDAAKAKIAKQIDKVFARLDNDNDGKISKSEAAHAQTSSGRRSQLRTTFALQ